MNEDAIHRGIRRLGLSPNSLRWRLQLWQGFLVIGMMVGFGTTVYQLQRLNRLRQIDGDLDTRVTAVSRAIREVYRDAPPPGPPPVESPAVSERTSSGKQPVATGLSSQAPEEHSERERRPNGPPPKKGAKRDPGPRNNDGPQNHEPPHDEFDEKPSGDASDRSPSSKRFSQGPGDERGLRPDFGPGPDERAREGERGPGPDDQGRESEPGRGFGPPPDPPPDGPGPHGPPPLVAVPISSETAQLFGPASGGYYFVIWYRTGKVLNESANAPPDSAWPTMPERDTLVHYRTRGDFREAVHCSGLGECAVAGRSIAPDLASVRAFGWALLGAGLAIVFLGFGLGWWLIGRAIRPVEEIGNAAVRIAQGNLSERIKVGNLDDELGRLAGVLNSTFMRLEASFVRQQQFTSNAAHELRTPLSILILEAQTTLSRVRSAEEYRETIEGSLETAQQMRKITETLLELARFDLADPSLQRESVDLAEIAARCIVRLEPVAARDRISILEDFLPARARAVPGRLEVVITNLLTNALHYNKPGGNVAVTTYSDNGAAVLKVRDTGIGIAPDDLPHIFDRFYRADKARSRSQGHAGLGLAICKTIIEAELGEIEVVSAPNEGTTFFVRFPAVETN